MAQIWYSIYKYNSYNAKITGWTKRRHWNVSWEVASWTTERDIQSLPTLQIWIRLHSLLWWVMVRPTTKQDRKKFGALVAHQGWQNSTAPFNLRFLQTECLALDHKLSSEVKAYASKLKRNRSGTSGWKCCFKKTLSAMRRWWRNGQQTNGQITSPTPLHLDPQVKFW